ncbi:MAG TPA: ABC transporter permease [Candidatus Dormibacteraeota bacterium]|nr:ABC transporter permease [Candidatus Dormibacteraeota bacterium]
MNAGLVRAVGHRDLLVLLVRKELKIKYKGTMLGFLWSLLNPLLMMVVYSVVFSLLVRFQVPRYPIFLLSGMLPWNAFTIALSTASMTIVGNGNLIRRVSFPREFLPLASVLASVINLVLSMAVLLGFALVFRQPLGAPLLLLPVLLLLQLVLTAGICLVLAGLMVYFRDIENLITIAITVVFFVTPVIYPLSALGHSGVRQFLELNPLLWLITAYQNVWHDDRWPDPHSLLALTLTSVVALALGLWAFRRLEPRFPEEV